MFERPMILSPHGCGLCLDRRAFDRTLFDAACGRGVVGLCNAAPSGVVRRADGWTVSFRQGGAGRTLRARFLIDASGRSRVLTRLMGLGWRAHHFEIGIIGHMPGPDPTPGRGGCLLIEAVENGWWYSVDLPGGALVAGLICDPGLPRQSGLTARGVWEQELGRTIDTRQRLGRRKDQARLRVEPASGGCLDRAAGPGWIAVGDAASTVDPATGSGIARAIAYAQDAAEALIAEPAGPRTLLTDYADGIARDYADYLYERAAYYRLERRWPRSDFWLERQRPAVANPKLSYRRYSP